MSLSWVLVLFVCFPPQSSCIWNWRLWTCLSNHSFLLTSCKHIILLSPKVNFVLILLYRVVPLPPPPPLKTYLHLVSSTPHSTDFFPMSLSCFFSVFFASSSSNLQQSKYWSFHGSVHSSILFSHGFNYHISIDSFQIYLWTSLLISRFT